MIICKMHYDYEIQKNCNRDNANGFNAGGML